MKEESNNKEDLTTNSKRKYFEEPYVCPICKGEGVVSNRFVDEICEECDGEGMIWKY